ncbi:hypothetical protein ACFLYR_05050 [Chloroflexota bacterium]
MKESKEVEPCLEEMAVGLPGEVVRARVVALEEEARGAGRMRGTRPRAGPGGECACPSCGARIAHQVGTPCYNLSCPKCGAKMVRG